MLQLQVVNNYILRRHHKVVASNEIENTSNRSTSTAINCMSKESPCDKRKVIAIGSNRCHVNDSHDGKGRLKFSISVKPKTVAMRAIFAVKKQIRNLSRKIRIAFIAVSSFVLSGANGSKRSLMSLTQKFVSASETDCVEVGNGDAVSVKSAIQDGRPSVCPTLAFSPLPDPAGPLSLSERVQTTHKPCALHKPQWHFVVKDECLTYPSVRLSVRNFYIQKSTHTNQFS